MRNRDLMVRMRTLIVLLALLYALPASAAGTSAQLAALTSFDREVRGRLEEARSRDDLLRKTAGTASYEEITKAEAIDRAKDRESAAAVQANRIPPELAPWARSLQTAKQHASGALQARADGNARLARTRENAYAAIVDGLLAQLRK